MVTMNERGAFSVPDFCNWAGIGRTKVYEEIDAKRLPVVKVGKRTLIRVADAQAWLQSLPSRTGSHRAAA